MDLLGGGGVWGGVHPPQPWLGGCRGGGAIFLNKEEKITNDRQ